ncbi:interferon-induced very large GTPase 1 [Parambassis ranga]|uniref:Interferon-induced very large GTPase 1 n=1 Tax=Parambassis ranga TaxID=210632 RepID=A0A6P7JET1_9TELE|nr:interferon-induced very large GTPase 1-like [Parambassis ranga]
MSVKLNKRLSSKKKKFPKDNAQAEVLQKLGLEACWTTPLDTASMLDISTWTLEDCAPGEPKDLPKAFLRRLWLLSRDARSSCCQPQNATTKDDDTPLGTKLSDSAEGQCVINPVDLVTALFMSADTFLQQEMTVRMVQCQFAVPLVLPNIDPEEPSRFLLWPSRAVVSQWTPHFLDENSRVQEGDLASTGMPVVSCVKLGRCSISKSKVLNHVLSGLTSCSDTFLHRGMEGGQLPRRLSNGLVEMGWYLPTGDITRDIFSVPVVISNLRGDASTHEKCFSLLCHASSAVVVFCGDLREKEKQLLSSYKEVASKLILIDLSDSESSEYRVVGFVGQSLDEHVGLPEGSVLRGKGLSDEELADKLCEKLKNLLSDNIKFVTLEAAANLAAAKGLNVDEGPVCKKAMATVEEVLKGLDEGSVEFRQKQLPLQGPLWSKLAELEKEESKDKKEEKEIDPQLQKERKDLLAQLSNYKMTPAMKIFTDALFTTNKVERTYFLSWIKLRLQQMQRKKQNYPRNAAPALLDKPQNGAIDDLGDSDSFCTDSFEEEAEEQPMNPEVSEQQCETDQEIQHILQCAEETTEPLSEQKEHAKTVTVQKLNMTSDEKVHEETIPNGSLEEHPSHPKEVSSSTLMPDEKQQDGTQLTVTMTDATSPAKQQMCCDASPENQVASSPQPFEPDPSTLGLEHFLREMGLIFELTHVSPGSGCHNVLRLPSIATDLLLYGIPLELMDGDASNIPFSWLSCVFAELKRRLPQELSRTRVLTNLGVHDARNAEVLSALFGVKFPEGRKRSSRGVYMVALCVPDNLRNEMECDFLLLIDVEGLCSIPLDNKRNIAIQDNEMATVATGLSDVLLENVFTPSEFDTNFSVIVNALLRIKERGSMPICHLVVQDEGISSVLQASLLQRVSDMLQAETGDRATSTANKHEKPTSCRTCVKGPWSNTSMSEPVETQYGKSVLKLKENLFEALKKCAPKTEATGLSEFIIRLSTLWDAVKAESFTVGLQNTDTALAFSLLCTEFSHWEDIFIGNMETWLMGAAKKILATNSNALDAATHNELLNELKNEAREEANTEENKVKKKLEAYLTKDDKMNTEAFRSILLSNVESLKDRVTEVILQKLSAVCESHCSTTQLKKFEAVLAKKQESKLNALVEKSKSTKILLQDADLEEEFDSVWSEVLSNFDFRPSEKDDITARVTDILRQNLTSRDLQKHIKKLEVIGQPQPSGFQVYDEHFGYRSRLKHMFEDNNRIQRMEAQQLASKIIDECNQFVAHKCSLLADFSDRYITEILENVEKAVKQKSLEIRSAFEVDLKVYLCNAVCQDFQKLHDRYAKDKELLTCITEGKSKYLAMFIYYFRKRDQCQRVAESFIAMVIKPTVLNYINSPLGMHIVEEIRDKVLQFQSPRAFHQNLLEELIKEDRFESFLEYLGSYDNFRMRKIQNTVIAHLSESTNLGKWRQQRLGEIVGNISAAVSDTADGTNGLLSDTKPLLERVCLTLERNGDVNVSRDSLTGPLFSITTEWDCFVKCLMELLATLRLNLAQEFSQKTDIPQLLDCLPIKPQHILFNRVRGCDSHCPLCGTLCEEAEVGHQVHSATFHRPIGMLPYESCGLTRSPTSITGVNPRVEKDTQDVCQDLCSLYPNWNISTDEHNSQKTTNYWRYVLVRFNRKFAEEFKQKPARIPEEWRTITQQEAIDSLRMVFLSG